MPTLKTYVIAVGSAAVQSGLPDIDLVFSGQPAANDTITIGGYTFTFVASGGSGQTVTIGAGLTNTITNLVTAIQGLAATNAKLTPSNVSGTTLRLVSKTTGVLDNNYPVSWKFATATLNPDGAGASTSGNRTLDGGSLSLTNGSGSRTIEIDGDGSVRFTTSGGQLVAIRDVQLNKLLAELIRDSDQGLGANHVLFGVTS